jgi:hypothetical protein
MGTLVALRTHILRAGVSCLLVSTVFAIATVQPAAGTSTKCPTPIESWVYPLSSARFILSDNVFPGQTFDVSIAKTSGDAQGTLTFTGHGLVREVCSQRTHQGKRLILFKALQIGTSEITVSLRGSSTILHGQIIVNPAPPATIWPRHVTARVVSAYKGYAQPVPFDALVPRSDYPKTGVSMFGDIGYALTTLNGFQYAVRTTNGGSRWRVAGSWFAGPWADGAAFAGSIHAFSASTVVADGDGQLLYTTTDAGKRWYGLFFSGVVLHVSLKHSRTFVVRLGTEDGVGSGRTYLSTNGGLNLSLAKS